VNGIGAACDGVLRHTVSPRAAVAIEAVANERRRIVVFSGCSATSDRREREIAQGLVALQAFNAPHLLFLKQCPET
jgi:hypothetical protein